jgi:hypothetical protein
VILNSFGLRENGSDTFRRFPVQNGKVLQLTALLYAVQAYVQQVLPP